MLIMTRQSRRGFRERTSVTGTSLFLLGALWIASCQHDSRNGLLITKVHGWRPRFMGRKDRDRTSNNHNNNNNNKNVCEPSSFLTLQDAVTTMMMQDEFVCVNDDSPRFVLPQSIEAFLDQLKAILWYKPPVGIVTIAAGVRLLWTGRIFRWYTASSTSADSVLREAEKHRKKRKQQRKDRALHLDADDQSYDSHGGVERVRRKLCWAALAGDERRGNANILPPSVHAAVDALRVSYSPGEPRSNFVDEIAEPLSRLETALLANPSNHLQRSKSLRLLWGPPSNDLDVLLQMAAKAAEIRALDALLRLARDRLLTTSSRLGRTMKYWRRRVRLDRSLGKIWKRIWRSTIEGDRLRLVFAKAAYEAEVARLGLIQTVLIERPEEMSDKELLTALSRSKESRAAADTQDKKKRWSLSSISNYALRFNAEGKGGLTVRVYKGETKIDSAIAWEVLLENNGHDPRIWIDQAHDWTERARRALCDIITESLRSSISDSNVEQEDITNVERWCSYDCGSLQLDQQWKSILSLVDDLADHRRVGEGRALDIAETGVRVWREWIDVMGIPSSLAAVGLAQMIHNYLAPNWPQIREGVSRAVDIAWTIFEQRFWTPFYGILLGLMNKGQGGLLEAFDVENEEKSLDNMLRDLGFGDGTANTRKDALKGAARAYEGDLHSGVFRSVLRGHIIRLLLVQVQQLKAGLLHAMESIDVLVDANRLNIQILTAIPAVLLVTLGTRFFVRSLFTFRTKDIRPVRDVHAEMAEYLDEMEKTLLLTSPPASPPVTLVEEDSEDQKSSRKVTISTSILQPSELGEFVLLIHSYLVLLDYCCPPFPSRSCDAIQKSMQDMLALQGSMHRLGTDRQVAFLRLIKQKHMDLLKYL